MKVICILCVYNEIDILPHKVEWADRNGLDLYIMDNYSTDGTWEMVNEMKIPCSRIDTGGAFDTRIIEKAKMQIVDNIKPEWVIHNGADLFHFYDKPVWDFICDVDKQGFNMICSDMIDVCRTEKEDYEDPFHYKYYRYSKPVTFVFKYIPGVKIVGDEIVYPVEAKVIKYGLMVNFGRTKLPEQRKELLRRRRKAWANGLDDRFGRHYLREAAQQFRWRAADLELLKGSRYNKFIKAYLRIRDGSSV
jgi:glycosyltransferase involved in cell wall biosynthesis